jgi:hypothetical protein
LKDLPVALTDQLKSTEYRPAILVEINTHLDRYLYTTWSQPILFDEEMYLPRGMAMETISYSDAVVVDNVSINLDDTDRTLYGGFSSLVAGDYHVEITLVVLNEASKIISDMVGFVGFLDEWNYEPGRLKLVAKSIFARWARETTTKFSSSCRWRVFNGPECQVPDPSIGTQCDRTYTTCSETYHNQDHFGGFRWLPSLLNKTIDEL